MKKTHLFFVGYIFVFSSVYSQYNIQYKVENVQAIQCVKKLLEAGSWEPYYPAQNPAPDDCIFVRNNFRQTADISAGVVGELSVGAKATAAQILETNAKVTSKASAEISRQNTREYGREIKICLRPYEQYRYARYAYYEKYTADFIEFGINQYGRRFEKRTPITYLKRAETSSGFGIIDVVEVKKGNQITPY